MVINTYQQAFGNETFAGYDEHYIVKGNAVLCTLHSSILKNVDICQFNIVPYSNQFPIIFPYSY